MGHLCRVFLLALEYLISGDEPMQEGGEKGGKEACRFPFFPWTSPAHLQVCLVSMGNDGIEGKKTIFLTINLKNSTLKKEIGTRLEKSKLGIFRSKHVYSAMSR